MSKVVIAGDASGTGTFTISAPNGNTDRTLVLPDEAGTVLTTAGVPASAINNNSITSAKLTGDAIPVGVGQTWQNVISERSANVTYTNDTGRPIMVMISDYGTASVYLQINGDNAVIVHQSNTYGGTSGISAVIPNGDTYLFTAGASTWWELR